MLNQQPPMSLESEEAVLGSLLLDPKSYLRLATFLTGEHFFLKRHEHVWNAFAQLHERGDNVDYITLSEELENMKLLDEIGGQAYLVKLVNNTPTAKHAEVYGEMVLRTYIRRQLLTVADQIRQHASDESMQIDQVFSESENAILALKPDKTRKDLISLQEVLSEYYDEVERINEEGVSIGTPTGFYDIDMMMGGLQRSDLVVFAGRTGMGKTSWLLTTAVNVARLGNVVVLFTTEMGVDQVAQRIIAMESGLNIQKLREGLLSTNEFVLFTEVIGRLSELPIYIDDSAHITPTDILIKSKRVQHEMGLSTIIVDYMQNMSAGRKYQNNRVQEISYISRELKEIARELRVTVLAAAQLSRRVEERSDKRPQLSDLRESGSIEQDADSVLFLYREEYYEEATEFPGLAEVALAKNRHGPTGKAYLHFDENIAMFKNAAQQSTENLISIPNL